jgi:cell division protein FtsL
MPILVEHKLRNEQMRLISLIEIVAKLQSRVRLFAYQPLDLERQITEASRKQRIFAIAFDGKAGKRTPVGTDEVRLAVCR